MNEDRTRQVFAVLLSIGVHASSLALVGDIQLGSGQVAGAIAVTVQNLNTPEGQGDIAQLTEPTLAPSQDPQPEVPEIPNETSVVEPTVIEPPPELVSKIATDDVVKELEPSPNAQVPVQIPPPKPVDQIKRDEIITEEPSRPSPAVVSSGDRIDSNLNSKLVTSTGTGADASTQELPGLPKPDVMAFPLYHLIPKPPYPSRSLDLGEEGTVIVAILVGANGQVDEANISTSSGYPLLDGSALATVRAKWRFKPAKRRGKPVESWVRVPIRFNISAR